MLIRGQKNGLAHWRSQPKQEMLQRDLDVAFVVESGKLPRDIEPPRGLQAKQKNCLERVCVSTRVESVCWV